MDQDHDLERCNENRENATRADNMIRVRASTAELFSFFSILIGLIQVKYQNRDASPYKTHPLSMAICLAALCTCALAIWFKMIVQTRNWAAHIINHTILISGVLVIAAVVSVLVTNQLSWIIYIIWAIFSVMVVAWNSIQVIKQWWLYERTENVFLRVIDVFRIFKQRLMINVGRRMLEPQGPGNV